MISVGFETARAAESTHAAATVVGADRRIGRLIRTMVVTPKAAPPKSAGPAVPVAEDASSVKAIVDRTAKSYGLDPLLVHSVIQVESGYNRYAVSNKGAEGLMQLIPATARRFGASNSFSPGENIEAGVRYLKYLKDIFGDDRLALAAYNAGEGAVARHGWTIPPYAETRDYVDRVGKKYGDARRAADLAQAQTPPPAPAAPPVEEHPKLEQYSDEQGRIYLRTR